MAAALGETTDPKELVEGEVGVLGDLAATFTRWSDKFNGIGDGLRDVRIPGWTGQASDAFWPTLSKEKTNWYLAADAMSGAAVAVTSYASMLSWAQQQAGTAIDLWAVGQHEAAEEVLKTARQQLKQEAEALAKKLSDLAGGASSSPNWLTDAREWVDTKSWMDEHSAGKTSQNLLGKEGERWQGGERRLKEWGKDENGNWYVRDKPDQAEDGNPATGKKANVNVTLAEWKGSADVWSANAPTGEGTWHGAHLKGTAGISLLGVEGSASGSYGDRRGQMGLSGSAYLAKASASGSAEYGLAAAQAEANGLVGATVSSTTSIGKDGLHSGFDAFAGAKATGALSADVGGIGAGVSGEAWAGAGISAGADVGMKDGKITVGGEYGIGLGLGAKASVDITIDPAKVIDSADDAADAVGDAWDSTVGSWL
jgi:hypothetical protein